MTAGLCLFTPFGSVLWQVSDCALMHCAAPADSAATRQGLLSLALPFLGRKLLQMGSDNGEAAASSFLIILTDMPLTNLTHQKLKALHGVALSQLSMF